MPVNKSCTAGEPPADGNRQLMLRVPLLRFLIFLLPLSLICSCAKLDRHMPIGQPSTSTESVTDTTRINLNSAPASELETLPGIGHVLAERIVEYREQHGSFRRAEHLMLV